MSHFRCVRPVVVLGVIAASLAVASPASAQLALGMPKGVPSDLCKRLRDTQVLTSEAAKDRISKAMRDANLSDTFRGSGDFGSFGFSAYKYTFSVSGLADKLFMWDANNPKGCQFWIKVNFDLRRDEGLFPGGPGTVALQSWVFRSSKDMNTATWCVKQNVQQVEVAGRIPGFMLQPIKDRVSSIWKNGVTGCKSFSNEIGLLIATTKYCLTKVPACPTGTARR